MRSSTRNTSPTATSAALFPPTTPWSTYGSQLQGGYFVVPKKLELARPRLVDQRRQRRHQRQRHRHHADDRRDHGRRSRACPARHLVHSVNGAFATNHSAYEYAVGVNYYFYRQLVKWQTDVSFYQGGNPASGGQSPAGFIPGVDGWMLRTQIQFAF